MFGKKTPKKLKETKPRYLYQNTILKTAVKYSKLNENIISLYEYVMYAGKYN